MEGQDIDKLFREGLEGASQEPGPELWTSIASELDGQNRAGYWRWAALLLLLIIGGGAFYVQHQEKEIEALEIRLSHLEEDLSMGEEYREAVTKLAPVEARSKSVEKRGSSIESSYTKEASREAVQKSTEQEKGIERTTLSDKSKSERSLPIVKTQRGNRSAIHEEEQRQDMLSKASIRIPIPLPAVERSMDTTPCCMQEIPELMDTRVACWSASSPQWHLRAGLNYYDNRMLLSARGERANMRKKEIEASEQSKGSMGAELLLERKLGNRWSLHSGVAYASWSRDGEYELNLSNNTEVVESSFSGEIIVNLNEELETSTGVVPINGITALPPNDAILATEPHQLGPLYVHVEEKSQRLIFPLMLSYKSLKRTGLRTQAGISYEHIVKQRRAYRLSHQREVQSLSESQDAQGGYFSAQLGLDLFHTFCWGPRLSFGPRYSAALLPLREENGLKSLPQASSLSFGLEWPLR